MTNLQKDRALRTGYMLLFAVFMIMDWMVGSRSWFIWMITNNLAGIGVAFLCYSAYGVKEFLKPFYIVFSVVCVVADFFCFHYYWTHQVGNILAFWVMTPLNVWFLGMAGIKLFEKTFLMKNTSREADCKNVPKAPFYRWEILFALCMLLMVFSRSNFLWPLYYLLIFEILFHTPLSSRQKRCLLWGMLDGIILGFALIQTYAFFRFPYVSVRYEGAYADCNRNSCMYQLVLAAFLAKNYLLRLTDDGSKRNRAGIVLSFLFTAVMSAFIFLTGCRTAFVSMLVMFMVYLFYAERKVFGCGFCRCILKVCGYLAAAAASLLLVYLTIRYTSALGDRIKYEVSGHIESKKEIRKLVDKEAYVTLDQVLCELLGRFKISLSKKETPGEAKKMPVSPFAIRAYAIETPDQIDDSDKIVRYRLVDTPEEDWKEFVFPDYLQTGVGSVNVRMYIYLTYLRNLNLTGHTEREGFYYIYADGQEEEIISQNAQNLLLYLLYNFGIPVGLFAFALLIAATVWIIRQMRRGRRDCLIYLLFYIVFWVMGLQEVVWIPGQLVLVMVFFCLTFIQDRETDYLLPLQK